MPSVIIIIIVAHVLNKFKESKAVQSVFYALRPAVTGLIAVAGFGVFKISVLTLDKFNVTHHWADFLNFKAALLFMPSGAKQSRTARSLLRLPPRSVKASSS